MRIKHIYTAARRMAAVKCKQSKPLHRILSTQSLVNRPIQRFIIHSFR